MRTIPSVFVVAARRLWANRWMSLASAVGFIAAVTLAFSVPLYADAVYHRILSRELGIDEQGNRQLPPFAFLFRYNVFWQDAASWPNIAAADHFVEAELPGLLQLPPTDLVRYFQTANLRLYSPSTRDFDSLKKPLLLTSLASISRLGDHINLVQGRLPVDRAGGTPEQPGPIEVLVSRRLASTAGFQVGDRYYLLSGQDFKNAVSTQVEIAGVWEPRDWRDPYWFYRPDLLDGLLMTPEETMVRIVGPRLQDEMSEALWFANFDGDGVRVWNVDALIGRIGRLGEIASQRGIKLSISASPEADLMRYRRDSQALTIQLFAFSIPLFVLVLAFIILVASLSAAGQRNEIAVLRSRGASAAQVLGIAFVGACVLGGLALAAGVPAALGLVQLVGQARSFLRFALDQPLPVAVTASNLPFGLAMAALAVIITTGPIAGVARHTILTYKQEQARALRPPAWQRAGLDVLLLIPAGYWTYLLVKQGTLDIAATLNQPGGDPFSNPSLFLLPGLAMLAVTLLVIRAMPLFLRLLAWLMGRLPGTALVLATRQLARSPGLYASPVLLLTLTLALAIYTASVAATLDRALDEQMRYTIGSDLRLYEVGQDTQAPAAAAPGAVSTNKIGLLDTGSQPAATTTQQRVGPRWQFLPLSEYARVDGVASAARAGNYTSVIYYAVGGSVRGHFLGVDRLDFPRLAYWRSDFASRPLGELMNALASAPDAVLMPESELASRALNVGDRVQFSVSLPEADVKLDMVIAGTFKLWPGWFPNQKDAGPLLVGNLDYLFDQGGGQAPYDIWVKMAPGADPERLAQAIRQVDKSVTTWRAPGILIEQEQIRPQRQGLLGMLSIGFGGAAFLTVAGFGLYAAFTLRRRLIEMGVLRAIGFDTRQMAAFLCCELALLLGAGLLAGTLIGLAASRLYIPFLQEVASDEMRTLSFQVIVNWPSVYGIYAVFILLFLAAIGGLLIFTRRMKIFQAVKLGETV